MVPVSYTHLDVYKRQVFFSFGIDTHIKLKEFVDRVSFDTFLATPFLIGNNQHTKLFTPVTQVVDADWFVALFLSLIHISGNLENPEELALNLMNSSSELSLAIKAIREALKVVEARGVNLKPVSYTHLDVYKRQSLYISFHDPLYHVSAI